MTDESTADPILACSAFAKLDAAALARTTQARADAVGRQPPVAAA